MYIIVNNCIYFFLFVKRLQLNFWICALKKSRILLLLLLLNRIKSQTCYHFTVLRTYGNLIHIKDASFDKTLAGEAA